MKRFFSLIILIMSILSFSFAQQTPKEINQDLLQLQKMQLKEDNYFDSAYAFIQKRLDNIGTKELIHESDLNRCQPSHLE